MKNMLLCQMLFIVRRSADVVEGRTRSVHATERLAISKVLDRYTTVKFDTNDSPTHERIVNPAR